MPATYFLAALERDDDFLRTTKVVRRGARAANASWKEVAVGGGLTGLHHGWQCAPQSDWDLDVFPEALRGGDGLRES